MHGVVAPRNPPLGEGVGVDVGVDVGVGVGALMTVSGSQVPTEPA